MLLHCFIMGIVTMSLKTHQLVRFGDAEDSDKIIIDFPEENPLDQQFTVISIIGQARKGKSTFLNALLSSLLGMDVHVFKTSDGIETCTRGIHMLVYDKYIFLDCHGLGDATSGSDARHDPALLLLVYSLSNIIIHNVQSMNNFTLKELEALTVFLSEFETSPVRINIPQLIFRVRDYDLTGSLTDLTRATLRCSGDQFDGLKNTIVRNFSAINSFSTSTTSEDIEWMRSGNFLGLLYNEKNQFKSTIKSILGLAESESMWLSVFQKTLFTMADKINTNKINVGVLDVTEIYQQNIIIKYIDVERKSKRHLWYPFVKTFQEDEHTTALTQRQAETDVFLMTFSEEFDKLDRTLVESYIAKLKEEFDSVMMESDEQNKALVQTQFVALTNEMDEYFKSKMSTIVGLDNFANINTILEHMVQYVTAKSETFIRKHTIPMLDKYVTDIDHLREQLFCNRDLLVQLQEQTTRVVDKLDSTPEYADFIATLTVDPYATMNEQVAKPFVTFTQQLIDANTGSNPEMKMKTLIEYTGYTNPVKYGSEVRFVILSDVLNASRAYTVAKQNYLVAKRKCVSEQLNKVLDDTTKSRLFAANKEFSFVIIDQSNERMVNYRYLIQQIESNTGNVRLSHIYFMDEIIGAFDKLFYGFNCVAMFADVMKKENNVYTFKNAEYTDVVRSNIIAHMTTMAVMSKYRMA